MGVPVEGELHRSVAEELLDVGPAIAAQASGRQDLRFSPLPKFGSSKDDIGWYMAVRNGLSSDRIIPANADFSAQLCAIHSGVSRIVAPKVAGSSLPAATLH